VSEEDGDNSTKTEFPYIVVDDSVPIANFTYSPVDPLEGDQVTFNASGSVGYDQPLSYTWNFSDGTLLVNLTDPIVTHTYAHSDSYDVILTVVDSDGSTDSTSQTITVEDTAPVANFSATPTSGPESLTVSFTDTSISYDGITAWQWDFDNDDIVDSTEQNPTYVYGQDDVYSVTLKVYEGDGYNDSMTKIDYVTVADSEPIADFSATSTGGPEPLAVSFTDLSTSYDGITSWTWNFEDGEISTEQNPIHKFPNNGTFNVMLTVTDADGSTDTITRQVLTYLPNNPFESPFPLFVLFVVAIIGLIISLGILFWRKL
jgi:PKD repeat protein